MGAGRPTSYTPEIAVKICTEIAQGQPLTKICSREDMPAISAVYTWLLKHPEFADMYTRAREDQADTYADQIIEIADSSEGGKIADVQSAALRVDARKWIAAKLKPRKYIDSKALVGADSGPLQIVITQDDDKL